ncbi:MAG: hypothetical protein HKL88_06700, partial [Bacteroidia bacterium]|nr:hypothetical protein [Bacteroidia bacterium]
MKETLERLNTVFDTITDLQPLLREVIKQGYRIIIARKLPDEEYHKHSEVLQKMTDICNLKKKALSENNYEYLALLRDRERAVEEWM